jgi:hypothetical protein
MELILNVRVIDLREKMRPDRRIIAYGRDGKERIVEMGNKFISFVLCCYAVVGPSLLTYARTLPGSQTPNVLN